MSKSLEEVLTEYEIPLVDSSGGRKVTRCMFHVGDNESSFTVYPNGTYFCFACEVWGDPVTFLVAYKGMSFDEAVAHVGADYKLRTVDKPQVIKVKSTLDTYKFLYEVSEEYHKFLLGMPGALSYLEKRGLTMETIKKYKLGYTDGKVLNLQWVQDQQLALEIGLINKNGFELLSHRITIPNLTEPGYADFLIGRTVTNDRIKYLGARIAKPIHGFYEVRHSPILFLAEGQFDWLTLRQWGFPAAVVGGTHLTKVNLNLIKDKKIIIIPDLDESGIGMKAAKSLQSQLGEFCYILDYSELKNPGEKLDVSSLAETKGGQKLFQTLILEQFPWIQLISSRTLARWFPTLPTITNLLST